MSRRSLIRQARLSATNPDTRNEERATSVGTEGEDVQARLRALLDQPVPTTPFQFRSASLTSRPQRPAPYYFHPDPDVADAMQKYLVNIVEIFSEKYFDGASAVGSQAPDEWDLQDQSPDPRHRDGPEFNHDGMGVGTLFNRQQPDFNTAQVIFNQTDATSGGSQRHGVFRPVQDTVQASSSMRLQRNSGGRYGNHVAISGNLPPSHLPSQDTVQSPWPSSRSMNIWDPRPTPPPGFIISQFIPNQSVPVPGVSRPQDSRFHFQPPRNLSGSNFQFHGEVPTSVTTIPQSQVHRPFQFTAGIAQTEAARAMPYQSQYSQQAAEPGRGHASGLFSTQDGSYVLSESPGHGVPQRGVTHQATSIRCCICERDHLSVDISYYRGNHLCLSCRHNIFRLAKNVKEADRNNC